MTSRAHRDGAVGASEPSPGLIVNTIPKAGTYLVARLLTRLGVPDSGLHLRNTHYWRFGGQPQSEVIADPNQFLIDAPLSESLSLIGPGEFAVAHLDSPAECAPLLDACGLRLVFVVRDLRDCLVSNMRFLSDPRRRQDPPEWAAITDPIERFLAFLGQNGPRYLRGVRAQLAWLATEPPVLRFEDLYGDHGPAVQERTVAELMSVAGVDQMSSRRARHMLEQDVVGQSTRTFSGRRTAFAEFQCDAVDERLGQLGVREMNAQLGY